MGPLHGVSVSLKEHIPIGGQDTNPGFMCAINASEQDSHLISLFGKARAALYAKTMQLQGPLHLEGDFPLGRVLRIVHRLGCGSWLVNIMTIIFGALNVSKEALQLS